MIPRLLKKSLVSCSYQSAYACPLFTGYLFKIAYDTLTIAKNREGFYSTVIWKNKVVKIDIGKSVLLGSEE